MIETQEELERFEKYVQKDPVSGCWNWIGSCYGKGYGHFGIRGKIYPAHRIAYIWYVGTVPNGLFVLHECDNPPCVNPDHLFLGTHQNNVDDKCSKGCESHLYGVQNSSCKLTNQQVQEIRQRYSTEFITQTDLAREYRVSITTINWIVHNKTWKHLTG
jgi:hypothetical protein